MDFKKIKDAFSLKNKDLRYRLSLIFGLFFIFPVTGFLIFALKYDLMSNKYVLLFFLGVLIFSFLGFTMLRRIFDQIATISTEITKTEITKLTGEDLQKETNELHNIVQSFSSIESQFSNTFSALQKKSSEISILKELSELCFVTFDPTEILYVTLERALLLTNSDVGSVMILSRPDRKSFIVKASIGSGEFVKVDDRIEFETSIAKYAVINKSPIVVKDIETDNRFGRVSRSHYGSKSFVCMPIKTSKEIVGVLTISRKEDSQAYSLEEVEILTPLLNSAAFTYENLRLIKENETAALHLKTIDKLFKVINSSFRDSELLHAVMNELQAVVPFDLAMVMTRKGGSSDFVEVTELITNKPTSITKGASYQCPQGSLIDRVLKQETTVIIDDTGEIANKTEKKFFTQQAPKSAILTPLKIGGNVTSVLALYAKKSGIFYESENLIEWMAEGLSLAIERNSLSEVVVKRHRELVSVKQIGSALASSTFDTSKVLKYTMDMIREAMNVEAGSLFLLKNGDLEFSVAFNVKIKSMKKFRLKMGQGIAGTVAAGGESMLVNDTAKSPHFYSQIDKISGFKTTSAVCVPMISKGKVIGVIEVLNKVNGLFDDNDLDLLQSIAASVSIAIENANLYKETVSLAEHERGIRGMFQKFVPKEILEKIILDPEGKNKAKVNELKTLTMMNIDIRGFSKVVRMIGPQKTVFLINTFFSVMGSVVFKHHGIVDKYLGDGFLAIFGAPVSSTMDADNAVAAALEMMESVPNVNDYFVRELGTSINIGISVHTGEAVVGNIGFDMKMDYTVIGDSVNTVFRIQDMTKAFPNGILISETTLNAARSRLALNEVGISSDLDSRLGDLRIYELLGHKE